MILNLVNKDDKINISYINKGKIHIKKLSITDDNQFNWKYCKEDSKIKSWDDKAVSKTKSKTLSKFRLYDIIKDSIHYNDITEKVKRINLNFVLLDKKNNKITVLLHDKVIVIGENRIEGNNIQVLHLHTDTFQESLQKLTSILNKVREPFLLWKNNEYTIYSKWLKDKYPMFSDFIFCYEDIFEKYDKTVKVKDSNSIIDIHSKLFPNNKSDIENIDIVECIKFKEIEDRLQLFGIMINISNVSKCPLKKCHSSIEIAESLLYEYFYNRNKVLPNKNKSKKEESYSGGLFEIHKKGKFENVLYLDFSSMYPSIIRQFSISVENYMDKNATKKLCSEVKFAQNANTSLPFIYEKLLSKRKSLIELKEKEDNQNKKWYLESYEKAIKECSNALYGCFGSMYFYFSNIDIAKSITMQAKDALQYSISEFNIRLNKLLKTDDVYVLYNATDSLMIDAHKLSEKTDKWKEVIVKLSNNILSDYAAKWGVENLLNLKIENVFKKLFLVGKNRYFYLDMNDKMDVSGLKSIHSTSSKFLQEKLNALFLEVLNKDMDKKQIIEFCKKNKKIFESSKLENTHETYKVTRYSELVIDDLTEIRIKEQANKEIMACAVYNHFIYKNNLLSKYKLIEDGDKVRWYYTNNKDLPVFAYFPKKYPYEIALPIDYSKQYELSFLNNVNQFLSAIGMEQIQKSEMIF